MRRQTTRLFFQQPKKFRVLTRFGSISSDDFHALISIPTTEDHKYQLEKKLESYLPHLDEYDGFNTYRLLKPLQSNIYKVFLDFHHVKPMKITKKSSVFREHFSKEAVRPLAGSSSAHASYLEQFFIQFQKRNEKTGWKSPQPVS